MSTETTEATARVAAPDIEPAAERADLSWEDVAYETQRRLRAAEDRVAGLERALVSRPAVEHAKGLLMGVFGMGSDAAFDALVRASQNANLKLTVIAERFLAGCSDIDYGEPARERTTRALAATMIGRGRNPKRCRS